MGGGGDSEAERASSSSVVVGDEKQYLSLPARGAGERCKLHSWICGCTKLICQKRPTGGLINPPVGGLANQLL